MSATVTCKSARPSRRTSPVAYVAEPPDPDDPLLGFAPYVHAAPRRNSITPGRQREFIAALAATGIVTQAAKAIGASLEALYKLRHKPGAEGFAAAWEAALDRGIARLEDCAVALAIEGEELPIASGGKLLGTYRKHNFGFIRFLLSQRRSERYVPSEAEFAKLRPGHPIYDQLRRQWHWEQEQKRPDIEDVRAEVLRRLAVMERQAIEDGTRIPEPDDPDYVAQRDWPRLLEKWGMEQIDPPARSVPATDESEASPALPT